MGAGQNIIGGVKILYIIMTPGQNIVRAKILSDTRSKYIRGGGGGGGGSKYYNNILTRGS